MKVNLGKWGEREREREEEKVRLPGRKREKSKKQGWLLVLTKGN